MPTPEEINAKLDAALATMAETDTMSDSLPVLFAALKQQIKDLLGSQLTPEISSKIDQVFDAAAKQKQEIADAIIAGTPEAPTP